MIAALPMLMRLLPYLLVCAALGGFYWLGGQHADAECEKARLAVEATSQSQTIAETDKADAAAAQREQAKIIQQAALAGARKAIAEAPQDACIDTVAPAAVLDALGLRTQKETAP